MFGNINAFLFRARLDQFLVLDTEIQNLLMRQSRKNFDQRIKYLETCLPFKALASLAASAAMS